MSRDTLTIETCEAWHNYLEQTRAAPPTKYPEIERWAWAHLRGRLDAIEARLEARREAVAA